MGDVGTVRKQLKALEIAAPGLVSAYSELALQTIPIALAKGRIDYEKAKKLEALFQKNQRAWTMVTDEQ